MPCTVWQSEGLWPDNRKRAISKEGLDYAGTVYKQPLLVWDAMLVYLSPSLCGLSSLPGFGVLERIIMDDDERLKKSQFERTKAVSKKNYLAPGPGYGVFVGVHVGYLTCIFCCCSVQSREDSSYR